MLSQEMAQLLEKLKVQEQTSQEQDDVAWRVVLFAAAQQPLSGWCRRDFLPRLEDIMQCLHCCLEEKRFNRVFIANDNVPREISLPFAYKMAEPLNLFQGLVQDPSAQAKAV